MTKKDKKQTAKKRGAEKKAARKSDVSAIQSGAVSAALMTAARLARMQMSQSLSALGLFAGQENVILALAGSGETGRSPSAIADELGVRAPTMTKTLNRLAAQGFVEKRGSGTDARKTDIRLTEKGNAALTHISAAITQSETAMLAGFSGKDVKSLVKDLQRIEANLLIETQPANADAASKRRAGAADLNVFD